MTGTAIRIEGLTRDFETVRARDSLSLEVPSGIIADGPRVEIVGRGFSEKVLNLLRRRREVVGARMENHHLAIGLRAETDTAPLVSPMVSVGDQVEEVRRGRASLEEER